jgi:hypothetical protein
MRTEQLELFENKVAEIVELGRLEKEAKAAEKEAERKEQMAAAKAERKEQMAAAKFAKRANTPGYCEHGR